MDDCQPLGLGSITAEMHGGEGVLDREADGVLYEHRHDDIMGRGLHSSTSQLNLSPFLSLSHQNYQAFPSTGA